MSNLPCYFARKKLRIKKDKFETLCYVKADLSVAPDKSKLMKTGICYEWSFNIILLVGLTELKAQVSWIDSRTVRVHTTLHTACTHLTESLCMNLGGRKKV